LKQPIKIDLSANIKGFAKEYNNINMTAHRQLKPSGFSFPIVQNVVSFAEMEI